MKTMVTGGAGFIGSHLVRTLIEHGHTVTCVDDESSADHGHFVWDGRSQNFKMAIEALTPDHFDAVDVVFHMAAEISVERCNLDPIRAYQNNVHGTVHVLDCASRAKVGRLVFSSSAAVYGGGARSGQRNHEDDRCMPTGTYGTSKLMGELACRDYAQRGEIDTVCLRYFNVFGEGQANRGSYSPVLATFMRQLKENQPLTVIGDGSQVRDYIHVSDVVASNLKAGFYDSRFQGSPINIGTGNPTSVMEIAAAICHLNEEASIRHMPPRNEVSWSAADNSRMVKTLGMTHGVGILEWVNANLSYHKHHLVPQGEEGQVT
jgi:UDP-glucose 4-epimerase